MPDPLLSVVCSTIGRPDDLARLLDSISRCEIADRIEFVLVDQGDDSSCTELIANKPPPGPVHALTSGRGLSVGRNKGMQFATAPIVAFPDDNCWYLPETAIAAIRILDERPELAGVSGMQITEDGEPSMLRWLKRPRRVSRTNFMRTTVSSTLFLRRSAVESAGPFDETIGAGSPGWIGAGEESDLVLRMLGLGMRIDYEPDIRILQDDDRDDPTPEYVDKMRRYGAGLGYLWRQHNLPATQLLYFGLRKVAGVAVRAGRGKFVLARADLAYLHGAFAGWRGVAP
jgi:glycosyltransferase involved in cell wall biosynthesis